MYRVKKKTLKFFGEVCSTALLGFLLGLHRAVLPLMNVFGTASPSQGASQGPVSGAALDRTAVASLDGTTVMSLDGTAVIFLCPLCGTLLGGTTTVQTLQIYWCCVAAVMTKMLVSLATAALYVAFVLCFVASMSPLRTYTAVLLTLLPPLFATTFAKLSPMVFWYQSQIVGYVFFMKNRLVGKNVEVKGFECPK